MDNVIDFVKYDLLKDKGDLLYLCKFGSHLYGTDTENSDTDYKGIFLPKKEIILCGEKLKHVHHNSSNDNQRNTNEDVDVELWSLQYFLDLVSQGETNGLDILFSPSNEDSVIYRERLEFLDKIFENPLRLFNPVKTKSFVGYAIGQAKKYGIKGSRLGVIKEIYKFIQSQKEIWDIEDTEDSYRESLKSWIIRSWYRHGLNVWRYTGRNYYNEFLKKHKLREIHKQILDNHYNDSYCFMKKINGEDALVICGKVHLLSISLDEFIKRIEKEYEKYGERSKEAEKNKGIDWKALSHALRAIDQMEELLTKGKIEFPLKNAKVLKYVKVGNYSWDVVENLIIEGLDKIEQLQEVSAVEGKTDEKFINSIILNTYEIYDRMWFKKYIKKEN